MSHIGRSWAPRISLIRMQWLQMYIGGPAAISKALLHDCDALQCPRVPSLAMSPCSLDGHSARPCMLLMIACGPLWDQACILYQGYL